MRSSSSGACSSATSRCGPGASAACASRSARRARTTGSSPRSRASSPQRLPRAPSPRGRSTDERVEVVTGDRDLFAIVRDPRVKVLYTLKGVSELAEVDEGWIAKKYGIPGDRYLDYALMRGDPSDGLPGVAGIGEKTASQILRRYGSLDAAQAAPDLNPGIRQKLKRSADYLEAARRVVAPVADAPGRGGDGSIPHAPRDAERARALGERYRLSGSIERLIAALPSVP